VVSGLTRQLAALGHTVDVVTMGYRGLPPRESLGGVTVYRVPCLRFSPSVCTPLELASYLCTAIPTALRLARRNRYEINHTHFIFPDGVAALILRRRTGLPYVVTAHGCLAIPHVLRNGVRVPFKGSWWGCTAAITTHIFAPGETKTRTWDMLAELYAEHPGDLRVPRELAERVRVGQAHQLAGLGPVADVLALAVDEQVRGRPVPELEAAARDGLPVVGGHPLAHDPAGNGDELVVDVRDPAVVDLTTDLGDGLVPAILCDMALQVGGHRVF
jgi:hypothetical protein